MGSEIARDPRVQERKGAGEEEREDAKAEGRREVGERGEVWRYWTKWLGVWAMQGRMVRRFGDRGWEYHVTAVSL